MMPIFPEAVRQKMSSAALKPIGWSLNAVAQVSPELAGDWAFQLFSRPRSGKSNLHDPEILQTSERKQYRIKSININIQLFRWPGSGPTVFLAHGWESNTSRWLPLIRALRALNFEVISIDAPAHGFSGGKEFNVPVYTRVLQEILRHHPADYFIGHSAGGMAGVYYLHQENKASLSHLILMSVPNELENLMDIFRQIVGMNDVVFEGLKRSFEAYFSFPMSAFSIHEFVGRLEIPGLVIHDQDDTIAPYEGGLAIHRNWSTSKLVTTKGLGHSLPGEEVIATLVNYLQQS